MALHGCFGEDPAAPEIDPPEEPGPELPELSPTKVALHRTQNRREGVTRVLDLLDLETPAGKNVIIKPNWNTADPPPASTHNDTLSQLVLEMQDRGATGVTVAERSNQNFSDVLQIKQLNELAEEYDFQIVNLNGGSMTDFASPSMRYWTNGFRFPDLLRDADYIVSTCCLKTHSGATFTMSLKLSVGMLSWIHMAELHGGSGHIRKMIAEINLAYTPEVIVMDGVKAFISGGPATGTLADGNVFVAGTDRVAVDAVGVAILKELGSRSVPGSIFKQEQILRAVELRLGVEGPDKIELVTGDTVSQDYASTIQGILARG
jgi:uncharacterized protein (DUF362 family)